MVLLERGKMDRGVLEIVDTESLVPSEHLLRKIDAAVDFSRLYEMVEPLYCEDNGRPSTEIFSQKLHASQNAGDHYRAAGTLAAKSPATAGTLRKEESPWRCSGLNGPKITP